MTRKPNYQFDRSERERSKASKKAEHLSAKQAKGARAGTPFPTIYVFCVLLFQVFLILWGCRISLFFHLHGF